MANAGWVDDRTAGREEFRAEVEDMYSALVSERGESKKWLTYLQQSFHLLDATVSSENVGIWCFSGMPML